MLGVIWWYGGMVIWGREEGKGTYYNLYYWEIMLNILVFVLLNHLASYGDIILLFYFITYIRVSIIVSAIC